jgi:hypothetical protein
MKRIEEEWKRMEEFPTHEISNMGRCRRLSDNIMLRVQKRRVNETESFFYKIQKNNEIKAFKIGKMVARYFVPNPNGYYHVRYKDGNRANFNYMNIEWVSMKTITGGKIWLNTKKCSMDEQILKLKETVALIESEIKHLKEGKTERFVWNEVVPRLRSEAYIIKKLKRIGEEDFIDTFTDFAAQYIIYALNRGMAMVNFERYTHCLLRQYLKEYNGPVKTVEFDESYMNNSDEIM